MQETRKLILDILRERGQSAVDEIAAALQQRRGTQITPVTVRHHLAVLQQEGYITSPELRRRATPGRPQHVYTLTARARALFPNNYQQLALSLIEQISTHLPPEGVNVILEGVADGMVREAAITGLTATDRLHMVVEYLNGRGYQAAWERAEGGVVLHTANCPYHALAEKEESLCGMDMRLVQSLTGTVPRRLTRILDGDAGCSYFLPYPIEDEPA